jgi:hypothetical protein
MTTAENRTEAIVMVERFLANWDRQEWMQANGEWASDAWSCERAEYDDALAAARSLCPAAPEDDEDDAYWDICEALDDAPPGARCDEALRLPELPAEAPADLVAAVQKLGAAASALGGAVRPDESDYIATGTIDPGDLRDECTDEPFDNNAWSGWDCNEGWNAYLLDDGRIVLNWWRAARGQRHDRDLWVLVGAIDTDPETMKYEVCNSISGHRFGVYEADSEEAAIDAACRDAGYDSRAHAEKFMGRGSELVASLVRKEKE